MSKHFEIIIFTASVGHYANIIIEQIDPNRQTISFVLDRFYCSENKDGQYIKDLRIISNRKLKNMIIVDNFVHSFAFQLNNGIPILDWVGDKNDKELKYLQDYLIEVSKCDDVAQFNGEAFKIHELVKY